MLRGHDHLRKCGRMREGSAGCGNDARLGLLVHAHASTACLVFFFRSMFAVLVMTSNKCLMLELGSLPCGS